MTVITSVIGPGLLPRTDQLSRARARLRAGCRACDRRHACGGGAVVLGMPNIGKVLARVFVCDLDAAIPPYEELAQARAERFGFRDT